MANKPFYCHSVNDVVIDGVCECGHLERDHGSRLKVIDKDNTLRESHGGGCCADKCNCPRFTWKRWMTITEFAATLAKKREERMAASA